ncbi:hypothetical protein [Allomesorhizobium alhagi]|jgi:hypothetical protein|uniref:Uncharacterized protein n=1 Tax=Mesorhizobium alhagi CCNWXJ12-2 TaxID=1107882 RepID=H0HQ32_9HYPH|nr:hypothetical protein [Mesorhizobium alhagi]EHK57141.1 hypothetical protein MAXJ12_11312 [Mesorhizobium alhagi CCNWXJ12-2]
MANNRDDPDRFARESFTFRRMRSWQLWSLLIVIALLVIGLLFWA